MVLAVNEQRMGEHMETDEQRAANERAQIEQVFGLTGGELEDDAWVPNYRTEGSALLNTAVWAPFTFTYWYAGVPDYVQSEYDAMVSDYAPIYRTVCRDETFGQVPETVTDDEGTWKVVARYRTSGECECPMFGEINTLTPCGWCDAVPGDFHGHIYIGDGWAEIVYRLEEIQRATSADAGCWVDGHWGQYAIAHMVEKAQGWGYADAEVIDIATRHLASIGPSEAPQITDDEHEALSDASDEVETWLNEHVAPEGFSFGWWEGEFFLWPEKDWEESY